MRCLSCGSESGNAGGQCPVCGSTISPPGRFSRVIARTEDAIVSIMLCTMVLLVLAQIVLRNFLATGITGGAEIVRHLVLWVAFIGAGIAAREAKHIKIDVAYRILPTSLKRLTEVLTGLFTVVVCGILLYASIGFVAVDLSSGTTIAFFDMPVWTLEVIIPLGYLAVMLRYAARCGRSLVKLLKGQ